ncbi:MAG: hypothetical protein ACKV2T_18040 [Kofleriaceae bacterium]
MLLWLAAASTDGSQLAVLVSVASVWSVPIPVDGSDHRKPKKLADRVGCATGGMPVFD